MSAPWVAATPSTSPADRWQSRFEGLILQGVVPATVAGVDISLAPLTLTIPVGPVPLPYLTAPRLTVLGASQTVEFSTYPGLLDAPEPSALVILDAEQRRAPTSVQIAITNATPGEEFMVAIDGTDVYPVTIDVDGNLDPTSIRVDEVHGAGAHTLTATGLTYVLTATFTLDADAPAHPAIQGPDADPVFIPESEVAGGGPYRWVLQDLMPGGLGSWVMPLNPLSMTAPHRRRTLSVEHTTSPVDGRFHAVESHQPPQDWQFAGYCPDQAFHEQLEAYAALNRRLYVIDHRQRAWVIAILGVEFRARKRQRQDAGVFNDWASDYTVNALILDQDWRTPA